MGIMILMSKMHNRERLKKTLSSTAMFERVRQACDTGTLSRLLAFAFLIWRPVPISSYANVLLG
jgi:hypothetical protein